MKKIVLILFFIPYLCFSNTESTFLGKQLGQSDFYLAPAVSIDFLLIDLTDETVKAQFVPKIGIGIQWSPDWWKDVNITGSKSFLSYNFFLSANINEYEVESIIYEYYNLDVIWADVRIIDYISIGLGTRFHIKVDEESPHKDAHFLLLLGFGTGL